MSRVLTAFIPTGIVGFALYKIIKTYFFASDAIVLWALALGGVALKVGEEVRQEVHEATAPEGVDTSPTATTNEK